MFILDLGKVCFKKNGDMFATVYNSKCVTVFLKQTLSSFKSYTSLQICTVFPQIVSAETILFLILKHKGHST